MKQNLRARSYFFSEQNILINTKFVNSNEIVCIHEILLKLGSWDPGQPTSSGMLVKFFEVSGASNFGIFI